MLPPAADRPKLRTALDQVGAAVGELLLGGLTTASAVTRQSMAVAMHEAARFRLLRLGSTLRAAADELGRYGGNDPQFSRRRLAFFRQRAWLLGRGLTTALAAADEPGWDRLTATPPAVPLPAAEVVCLGAAKKVTGAFVAWEFRLRVLADAPPLEAGRRLTWSAVFPVKPGTDIPAEGFLHLPQKQKFAPALPLDRKRVALTAAAVSVVDAGGGRLTLTDASTVTAGEPFADWGRFLDWSPAARSTWTRSCKRRWCSATPASARRPTATSRARRSTR